MKLGVVIGRFQTWKLTEGHRELLRTSFVENDHTFIIIGKNGMNPDDRNPLNSLIRKEVILEGMGGLRGGFSIYSLKDHICDKTWSEDLDTLIQIETKNCLESDKITIYGGRDNNLEGRYFGKYRVQIIAGFGNTISGTRMREIAALEIINSEDFRRGCIFGIINRFPSSYSVVDMVAYKGSYEQIILGRKGQFWMFPGGFVEKSDKSLKDAVIREFMEETGITLHSLNTFYLDTLIIDDPRFRKSRDFLVSTIFISEICNICNLDKKSEEFEEINLFSINEAKTKIAPWHLPILLRFESLYA